MAEEMPQYRSHKTVRALKITAVSADSKSRGLSLFVEDKTIIHVDEEWVGRHAPKPPHPPGFAGGYYVVYDDGYASWSPAAAFEAGYTKVSPSVAQHVFAGDPDARQSADVDHKVSRFRPTYRALTAEEKALHDEIKTKAVELEVLLERAGDRVGAPQIWRYKALAMTALEESIMWAVKALTS